jgi:hypothetical protein
VSFARRLQPFLCQLATSGRSLIDPIPFQLCDLRQDREYEFANALAYDAQTKHLNMNAAIYEIPDSRLNINRITTEPIHRIDTDRIALSHLLKKLCEA